MAATIQFYARKRRLDKERELAATPSDPAETTPEPAQG